MINYLNRLNERFVLMAYTSSSFECNEYPFCYCDTLEEVEDAKKDFYAHKHFDYHATLKVFEYVGDELKPIE